MKPTSVLKKGPFKIKIDEDQFEFKMAIVKGSDILIKAGKQHPKCYSLYQKLKGSDFKKIDLEEEVDLSNAGLEKFSIKEPEVFFYHLDEEPETSEKSALTVNEILERGGLTPTKDYYLMEITSDGKEINHKDNPDQLIQLRCPGSKFASIFRGQTPVSYYG